MFARFFLRTACSLVLVLSSAVVARSSSPSYDGRRYSFYARTAEAAPGGGPVNVWIQFDGRRYLQGTAGEIHIQLPAGLAVESGDTVRAGAIEALAQPWNLILRPTRTGHFEIRGTMRVDARSFTDESEWRLVLNAESDTIYGATADPVRDQRVEKGQRYRYAGFDGLIPIDGPEPIVQNDLYPDYGGRRASVVSSVPVRCGDCALSASETLAFRVVVDRHGRARDVQWAEHRTYPQPSSRVVEAARNGLDRWRFQAARARGVPTSDAIVVLVVVMPK